MAESARAHSEGGAPFIRADALASRERILTAAAALRGDRRVTMAEIAAAAEVGRSTLYRHFPSRGALERALDAGSESATAEQTSALGQVATLPFVAPGQLGRERPLTL